MDINPSRCSNFADYIRVSGGRKHHIEWAEAYDSENIRNFVVSYRHSPGKHWYLRKLKEWERFNKLAGYTRTPPQKLKNCYNCIFLSFDAIDNNGRSGFICQRKNFRDKKEFNLMIKNIQREEYRHKSKRCFKKGAVL